MTTNCAKEAGGSRAARLMAMARQRGAQVLPSTLLLLAPPLLPLPMLPAVLPVLLSAKYATNTKPVVGLSGRFCRQAGGR
jgi:hypothetical protein